MSKPRKPNPSDVARWVVLANGAIPDYYGGAALAACRRARDHAKGMLSSWGLGLDGKPKAAPVAS